MRVLIAVMVVGLAGCSDTSTTTTLPPAPTATTATTLAVTTPPPTTVIATTTLPTTTTTTRPPGVTLPPSDPAVTLVGIPNVRIGWTIEEARENAPFELEGELDPDVSENCFHVIPTDPDLVGVAFMVLDGIVARMEISPPSALTTRSGAGIGITEEQLRAMFPGQIENADNAVVDGTALAFVPTDEIDRAYRAIFVTDNGVVIEYRVGLLPAVTLGEGCA